MQKKKTGLRAAALGSVTALTLLSAAPGYAATVVAQSSAAAIELAIAGNPVDSGRVTATASDDGSSSTEGQVNPPIDVLEGQQLLNIGVLAQEAVADVVNRNGVSDACAGIAGEGGAVVQIGDSGCLTPGQPIGVSFANLDLTGTQLADPESALAPLNALGDPIIDQLLAPVTAEISAALADAVTVDISGTLGVVQAFCNASPGQATGSAELADSFITAQVGDQSFTLLTLPENPAPNTPIVTDLDEVINLVLEDLRAELNEGLDGLAAGLTVLIDPIQENLVKTIVADIADQLQPVEDNLLEGTLNKQTTTGAGQIEVTALSLSVLPAAESSPLEASLLSAEIANVTCGPNARATVGDPDPDGPDGPGGPGGGDGPGDGPGLPDVPTVIDAGAAGDAGLGADAALLGAGALALAGAAGTLGYRRFAAQR